MKRALLIGAALLLGVTVLGQEKVTKAIEVS